MATKADANANENAQDEKPKKDSEHMTKAEINEQQKKLWSTMPAKAAAAAAASAAAEAEAAANQTANKTTSTPNATTAVLDSKYFYEDEIYRVNKNGHVRFGMIVETPDTYSGDEDDDEDELKVGNVRVSWYPTGNETVCSENRLGLADRTLMPGDIVRRLVPGKETQRGFCREVNVHADLQVLGTKYIIKNVSSKRLRPITPWLHDGAVCYNSWVGSTRDVEEKAILKSTSGARIEIPSSEFYLFREHKTQSYQNHIFYPGNIVTGRLSSMVGLKKLTPELHVPTNKKGIATFRVESLRTEAVWVQWQCKALSEDPNNAANSLQQPASTISGDELKNLKRINLFDSCMLQLNDRNYLTFTEDDGIIEKRAWKKEITQRYKELWKEQRRQEKELTESGDVTLPMSNTNVIDKLKKKFNLQPDNDRSGKTKKKGLEKNKSKMSNLDATNPSKALQPPQQETFESDSDWVSEDCATDEEASSSENEQNVVQVTKISNKANDETKNSSPHNTATASSTPTCSPKHVIARLPYNKKNFRQLKKRSSSSLQRGEVIFRAGDELTTEAILVHSSATVVWQDGTIEENIPSINLYPINHLDNHEFFPGDYVSSGRDDFKGSFHDYGVIQKVDHAGRTAHVKWFTTYTSSDNPTPTYNGEQEMSVYDLKDHADFQYRPGTMVIRVANFVGEDKNCTAGQVMESLIEGKLKVWWVDGHISLCWPQDLFEVGQYDTPSEEEEDDDNSDNSWETESETSEIGTDTPKIAGSELRFVIYIERARTLVERLQEIFNKETEMECILIMRKLITLYKSCRNLDHLMNTTYFNENNFSGLVARLRKVNSQIWIERNKEQKIRMLKEPPSPTVVIELNSHSMQRVTPDDYNTNNTNLAATNSKEFSPKVVFSTTSSTPLKTTKSSYSDSGEFMTLQKRQLLEMARETLLSTPEVATNTVIINSMPDDNTVTQEAKAVLEENENATSITPPTAVSSTPTISITESNTTANTTPTSTTTPTTTTNNMKKSKSRTEKFQLINSAVMNLDKAAEKSVFFKKPEANTNSPQDDSGNFSRLDNCDSSSGSCGSPADAPAPATTTSRTDVNSKSSEENDGLSKASSNTVIPDDLSTAGLLCAKFCCIIKDQLAKCAEDVREKYVINASAHQWSESDQHESDKEEEILHNSEAETTPTKSENAKGIESEEEYDLKEEAPTVKEDAATTVTTNADETKNEVAPVDAEEKDAITKTSLSSNSFDVLPVAPKTHKFYSNVINVKNSKTFMRAVMREHKILRSSMPPDVWVKIFEDRLDLMSVLIAGPKNTPYEDCMFLFDFQLGSDYPNSPPVCHYLSFCSERLNPNLYEDGKVCVSLLGTWSGRDNEVWTSKSTLLQVIVSIQGLILVPDPYFNEAGYEKQRGTQQGKENARMYNEMVVIKVVQATTKILNNPPPLFKNIIMQHYFLNGMAMHARIKGYMELSKTASEGAAATAPTSLPCGTNYAKPEFPLIPASRGFCLTLVGVLKNYYDNLAKFIATNAPEFKDNTTVNVSTQTIREQSQAVTVTPAPPPASAAKLATSEDDNAI